MVTGRDLAIVYLVWIYIPQKERRAIFPLHTELLIKIAIINFASPAHTDGVAAHEPVDCGGIKRANEQVHVFAELVVVPQVRSEAPDGEIGDGVQLIEDDPEMSF